MDYFGKKFSFGKFYSDSHLESLNRNYRECVANTIQDHFEKGTLPTDEICVVEKKEFYSYLQEKDKVENDNIMVYLRDLMANKQ